MVFGSENGKNFRVGGRGRVEKIAGSLGYFLSLGYFFVGKKTFFLGGEPLNLNLQKIPKNIILLLLLLAVIEQAT